MSAMFHGMAMLAAHVYSQIGVLAASVPPLPSGVQQQLGGTSPPSTATQAPAAAATLNLPTIVLSIMVWAALLGALVILFMPERNKEDRDRIRTTALGASGLALLIAFFITAGQMMVPDPGGGFPGTGASGDNGLAESHRWLQSFPFVSNYHLDIDGMSLPLLMVSCLLFVAVLLLAWKRDERIREHVMLLLILETGVNGALCARDYMLMLIFMGMQIVPLFLLIREPAGKALHDARREHAAVRYAVFGIGAFALFTVGTLLAVTQAVPGVPAGGAPNSPSFDMAAASGHNLAGPASIAGFCLMFAAFLIMSGGFPFHRWLIEAVGDADSGVAALLTGIVSRLGGYAILRIALVAFPAVATKYSTAIVALAVVTTLWGALGAVVESDLRRMVGYVALAQTGTMLLGVAGVNNLSVMGSVLILAVGGLTSGLLVLLSGSIEERTRQRSIHRLGGLALQMPHIAGLWILTSLAVTGVPLLAGFTADFILFTGSFPQHRLATVVVMSALLVTGTAMLWTAQRIFFGTPRDVFTRVKDAGGWEYAAMSPLVVLIVLYGVMPGRMMSVISNGVQAIISSRLGGA